MVETEHVNGFVKAYIGVGSNIGDRMAHCQQAIERMSRVPGLRVLSISPWFLTDPVGVQGQDVYLNGVVAAESEIPARSLLEQLLGIEQVIGRVRKGRWEPRTIDLDLLLFGDEIIQEEGLEIPHPLMHERRFVLVPLARIAPDLIHPVLEKTVAELLRALPEKGQAVTPWGDD